MKTLYLERLADRHLWISNDRIAARFSAESGTIDQVDIHAGQPVSRNAKLLAYDGGVLRPVIATQTTHGIREIPIHLNQVKWLPNALYAVHNDREGRFTLWSVAYGQTLLLAGRWTSAQPLDFASISLRIDWAMDSRSTSVHGERAWSAPLLNADSTVSLRATDRIELERWMRRTGDYQGDFLIPEPWRRLLFTHWIPSGLARYQDLKPEYQHSDLKIYDADTWLSFASSEFDSQIESSGIRFIAQPTRHRHRTVWFPVFALSGGCRPDIRPLPASRLTLAPQIRTARQTLRRSPTLRYAGSPALGEFFNIAPAVVSSAWVQGTGMTRGCPGSYYWIWAWDNMVTGLAMLRWGDIDRVRQMLRFLATHRDIDGTLPMRWTRQLEPMDACGFGALDFLFSELTLACYGETQDKLVLRETYGILTHAFFSLAQQCDEQGWIHGIGMYPDLPAKLGRREQSRVMLEMGAWYGLCRNMEQIARRIGDHPTADKAIDIADRIENNISHLWDETIGFFVDSMDPRTEAVVKSYPLYSLLALESPFGRTLFAPWMQRMGEFVARHLVQPQGHLTLTPSWDPNHHSEPALSAWYPHWDWIAIQVLTSSHQNKAIGRWLETVADCYRSLGYCPEFVAPDPDQPSSRRWLKHGAAWNLNCTAGWYNALIHALGGVEFDADGITCSPATRSSSIKDIAYRTGKWSIQQSGAGHTIKDLIVDGQRIEGCLKLPTSFYKQGHHTLDIRTDPHPHPHPLVTRLSGAACLDSHVDNNITHVSCYGEGRCDLFLTAPVKPSVRLDHQTVDFHWDSISRTAVASCSLRGRHEILIDCSEPTQKDQSI